MAAIRAIAQPELGWDDQRWQMEESTYLALWRQAYSQPQSQFKCGTSKCINRKGIRKGNMLMSKFTPAWVTQVAAENSYRSLFQMGRSGSVKHPNAGLYALMKETFAMSDADFRSSADDRIRAI